VSNSQPYLVVEHLRKSFGGITALNDVTLSVAQGLITTVIGPNGAGKTTLFNSIAGHLRVDSGTIWFRGARMDRLPNYQIARRGIGRTFQLTRVLTKMSVIDNVRVAATEQPGESLRSVFGWVPAARRRELDVQKRARALLDLVHLGHLADDYAGTLSGGQRKLLEFARVMIAEPSLVLLDEPMAGVNRVLGAELIDNVLAVRKSQGTSFLIIEHDMDIVMTVSDRVIVMHEGRVIADGSPEAVQHDPAVVAAYLGEPAADTSPVREDRVTPVSGS
jgi:ABC-type branched-subunit amino acid transport system ATPase component